MKDEQLVHSPAEGLTDGFAVGGGSQPPEPSWHPDVSMTSKSGDSAPGARACEEFAGVGPSSGAVQGVQLVEGPESYTPGEGDSMVGGLGTPPRP